MQNVDLFADEGSGDGAQSTAPAPPPESANPRRPKRSSIPGPPSAAQTAGGSAAASSLKNPLAGVASLFQSAGKNQARQREAKTLQNLDAVSARDLLQMLFRVNRDRAVKEAMVFTVFFCVFLTMALLLHDVDGSFATTDALQDLLLDEEFEFDEGAPRSMRNMNSPYKKNYFEVYRREEIMQWTRGPLLAALHPGEYFNGQERQELRKPYILDSQRTVGTVRIRQARVTDQSCAENRLTDETAEHNGVELGRFDTLDGTCFAAYSESGGVAQTGTWTINQTGRVYPFVRGMSRLEGLIGYTGGPYGTEGYAVYLDPRNATAASDTVAQIQEDLWLDRATRAVAVDMALYSTQTRLLTVIRIVFETFVTGHVVKYARMFPVPVALYATARDWVRVGFEVVFLALVGYLTYVEIWKTMRDGSLLRYFSSLSTLVDLVFLILLYSFIITYGIFLARLRNYDFEQSRDDTMFIDLWEFAGTYYSATAFAGWLGMISFLRIFAYLGIAKQMQTVWATLDRSKTDLFTFLVGVGIIVIGFSILGHFLYGTRLDEWHNFASSMSSLLRFALGDADYDRMASIRPQLTPGYFVAYTAIVFLVALNLIIGIISEAFDSTYDDIFMSDRWKGTVVTLEEDTQAELNILQLRCNICCRMYLCSCICPLEDLSDAQSQKGGLVSHESGEASEDLYSHTVMGRCAGLCSACCGGEEDKNGGTNVRNLEMTTPNPIHRPSGSTGGVQGHAALAEAKAQQDVEHAGGGLPEVQVAGAATVPTTKEERLLVELVSSQERWYRLLATVRDCLDQARQSGQADLYEWVRGMYKFMPDSDSMYVSEMSLTLLIQNGVDVHGEPHAAAKALVRAYHDFKKVEVVTDPVPLEPPIERYKRLAAQEGVGHRASSASASGGGGGGSRRSTEVNPMGRGHHMQMFKVEKVNVDGVSQTRRLWIDIGTRASGELAAAEAPPCHLFLEPTLYNFDSRLRLKKRLPLQQLVLVELLRTDDRRINLVFSSQGSTPEEEENIGGLETTYTLQFSQRARRDEFHDVLQQALKLLQNPELEGATGATEGDGDEGGAGGAAAAPGGQGLGGGAGAKSGWGGRMLAAAAKSKAAAAESSDGDKVAAAKPQKKGAWGKLQSSLRSIGAKGLAATEAQGARERAASEAESPKAPAGSEDVHEVIDESQSLFD